MTVPMYSVAEIFKSVQGEGMYSGVPMTFIRFTGCSVGKRICHHCDTDFDQPYEWRGGGRYSVTDLVGKVNTPHVCLTGGEPLMNDLVPLLYGLEGRAIHIETSGTICPPWLKPRKRTHEQPQLVALPHERQEEPGFIPERRWIWVTVSPKPGYTQDMLLAADELKVIVPGLGNGEGWPTPANALMWASRLPVYLQPRNEKMTVNQNNLQLCVELVNKNPSLRLSVQMHKFLYVR